MTSPAKRPLDGSDYRARSPKRRKLGTSSAAAADDCASSPNIHTPSTSEQSSHRATLEAALHAPEKVAPGEDGWWPARAILKERGRGYRKQYLIDWEPHPTTREAFDPNWERASHVSKELKDAWKVEKAKKARERPNNLRLSQKQYRPVSTESSPISRSAVKADARQTSITPSLASTSSTTGDDDSGPVSPSLEISETQNQSSLSNPAPNPAPYTVQIPPVVFDRSEYESLKGSSQFDAVQTTPSQSESPSNPTSALRRDSSLAPFSYQGINSSQSSKSLGTRPIANISPTHQRLLEALSSSAPLPDQVEIPASVEQETSQPDPTTTQPSTSVVHESDSESASKTAKAPAQQLWSTAPSQYVSSQPTPPQSVHDDFDPHPPSSAQPQLQTAALGQDSVPQPLQPIEADANLSLETSSPLRFESQLPETRGRLASPAATSRGGSPLNPSASKRSRLLKFSRHPKSTAANMNIPTIRQSPRLQSATPVSHSKSPAQPSQQGNRSRTPQPYDEVSAPTTAHNVTSPLATNPPHIADYGSQSINPSYLSPQVYHNESSMSVNAQATVYDTAIGASALPIQQSIEEEPQSSAESTASKASWIQDSLHHERIVPRAEGVSLPMQPVVGAGEYLLGLPADAMIKSVYTDMIDANRKPILKFIHRPDPVGAAHNSASRTAEREEMSKLMERLQDTTTHMDFGLPGFATQYSIQSQEATAYAQYAGSKFVFLGYLIERLQQADCGIVIASKPGATQDLLADFLKMKHVETQRHDSSTTARAITPEALRSTLKVDLISTTTAGDTKLSAAPKLMIAFDSSFDARSDHIRRIRELHSRGRDQLLPVLHLLVTNSSEHVDRCLRKDMPLQQRLKLLVRGTYLARAHLGDTEMYIPDRPDDADSGIRGMHEMMLLVRKGPNRMLEHRARMVIAAAFATDFEANWDYNALLDPRYDELDDTPPKISEDATAAGTVAPTPRDGRMRTRSPISRSGTPSGRKRLLDVDAAASILNKRQRLTPMRDTTPVAEPSRDAVKIEQLQEQLKEMATELAIEKEARMAAEETRESAVAKLVDTEKKLQDWQSDHAGLLRRYEKQRNHNRTLYRTSKQANATNESIKIQTERVRETNTKLREENTRLKAELVAARDDLKGQGGDIGALEEARSEARTATQKAAVLEKSLENTKRDFEFTRQQYQQASNRAVELGAETTELETEIAALKLKASGEQRRLKELSAAERSRRSRDELDKLTQEHRALMVMARKFEEENRHLKKNRGVQTRGSSAQPPGSPAGVGAAGFGRRSRQNSPAVGVRAGAGEDRLAVPGASGSARDRVNAVRNEP